MAKRFLKQIYNRSFSIVDFFGKLSVVLLTIAVSLQIITRIFNVSFTWTVELSRFLFGWLGFIGLVSAIRDETAPKFTVLIEKLKGKQIVLFTLLTNLLVIVFLSALFISTFEIVKTAHGQQMSILPIQWSYVYISLPASLFFIIVIYIYRTRKLFSELLNKV